MKIFLLDEEFKDAAEKADTTTQVGYLFGASEPPCRLPKIAIIAHTGDKSGDFGTSSGASKSPKQIAEQIAKLYGTNLSELTDVYLVTCQGGMRLYNNNSIAQQVAEELNKKGASNVKVHAISAPTDAQLTGTTTYISKDTEYMVTATLGSEFGKKEGQEITLLPGCGFDQFIQYLNQPHNTYTAKGPESHANLKQIRAMNFLQFHLMSLMKQQEEYKNAGLVKKLGMIDYTKDINRVTQIINSFKDKEGAYATLSVMGDVVEKEFKKGQMSLGGVVRVDTSDKVFKQAILEPLQEILSPEHAQEKFISKLRDLLLMTDPIDDSCYKTCCSLRDKLSEIAYPSTRQCLELYEETVPKEQKAFFESHFEALKGKTTTASLVSRDIKDTDNVLKVKALVNKLLSEETLLKPATEDKELHDFVNRTRQKLQEPLNEKEAAELEQGVREVIKIMGSPQMREMQEIIDNFRAQAPKKTAIGMNNKADALEAAMYGVPLLDRAELTKNLAVQRALATRRRPDVYDALETLKTKPQQPTEDSAPTGCLPPPLARARDTLVSTAQKGVLLAKKYAPSYVTGKPEVESGHYKQTTKSYKQLLTAQKKAFEKTEEQQKQQDSAMTNKGPR